MWRLWNVLIFEERATDKFSTWIKMRLLSTSVINMIFVFNKEAAWTLAHIKIRMPSTGQLAKLEQTILPNLQNLTSPHIYGLKLQVSFVSWYLV